jgi:predicted PolB exonuclease-like 3'-5' exonuclease
VLVFDIETYPDAGLIQAAHGIELAAFRKDLKSRTGSDFLPPIYHIPIVIAVLWADSSFRNISAAVHTADLGDERSLVQMFWRHCDEVLGTPGNTARGGLLVSFNGTEFDVPVLELRALKYTLRANAHARDPEYHFDVPFFLANFQPSRRRGLHLATLSKLIGLPGKAMLDGSEVQSQFERGNLREIGKYCLLDVLQTYLLFLRCQVLQGMSATQYGDAVRSLTDFLSSSEDPNVTGASVYLESALSRADGVESPH